MCDVHLGNDNVHDVSAWFEPLTCLLASRFINIPVVSAVPKSCSLPAKGNLSSHVATAASLIWGEALLAGPVPCVNTQRRGMFPKSSLNAWKLRNFISYCKENRVQSGCERSFQLALQRLSTWYISRCQETSLLPAFSFVMFKKWITTIILDYEFGNHVTVMLHKGDEHTK